MGSTEWVEKHQAELEKKAVVYINSDSNGKGTIGASGSHALEQFVSEVAAGFAGSGQREVPPRSPASTPRR